MENQRGEWMEEVWYKEGLRFYCTQCGRCCKGSPGVVWISEKECEEIAQFLRMSIEDFKQKYTRPIQEKRALLEIGSNWACVFLKQGKECSVYELRPKQCKTFPWWEGVTCSKENWNDTKKYCEGLDHPLGQVKTKEEIDLLVSASKTP